MDIFNGNHFYRSLIKAPLSLSVRNQLGQIAATTKKASHSTQWSEIEPLYQKFSNYLAFLGKNGYLPLSFPFQEQLASELRDLPCTGEGQIGPGRRFEIESLTGVNELPSVIRLMNDKNLYSLVSLYLNAPAHLHTCQAWWQYPMGPKHVPSNAQLWHRDRDDLSELKLFFYATDVDDKSGPHAFIPKSHRSELLPDLFANQALSNPVVNGTENKFLDDAFWDSVGFKGDIKKWIGAAGTCFLEDTRGFHRAYLPLSKPRLIFSLVWTIGPGF